MPLGLGLQLGLQPTGRINGEEMDDSYLLLEDNSPLLLQDSTEIIL